MKDEIQNFNVRLRMRPSLKVTVERLAYEESRSFATMVPVLLQEALTARSSG